MDKGLKISFNIRPAHANDLKDIVYIYNSIIAEGGFTADLTPYTVTAKQEWFNSLAQKNNIFIIENDQTLAGYFYFSPWRPGREALKSVAEVSFFISKEYRGQGLGDMMMKHLISRAKEKNFRFLLAILLDTNTASIGLLKKYAFEKVGHLEDVAMFAERHCGQYLMLRNLS
jgi:L-amino acid N-acyltransferase YncA